MDRHGDAVADVPVPGPIPRDVDTWEDYEAVNPSSGIRAVRRRVRMLRPEC